MRLGVALDQNMGTGILVTLGKRVWCCNVHMSHWEVFTLPHLFRVDSGLKTGIRPEFLESRFFFWCNCHYIDQFRVQFLQPESPESDGTQKLINKPDTGFRAVWPFRHLGISVGTMTPSLKRLYFY